MCVYVCVCVCMCVRPPSVALNNASLNSINDFFRTVALTPQHSQADCFVVPPDIDGFSFTHFPESLVLSHLSSLDIRKSQVQMICQLVF